MNHDFSDHTRMELEARVTALVLGELTGDEAAALEQQIAADPELATWRRRLESTLGLVREAAASPVEPLITVPVTPRLSETRREALLARLRAPASSASESTASRPESFTGATPSAVVPGPWSGTVRPTGFWVAGALAAAASFLGLLTWLTLDLEHPGDRPVTLATVPVRPPTEIFSNHLTDAVAIDPRTARPWGSVTNSARHYDRPSLAQDWFAEGNDRGEVKATFTEGPIAEAKVKGSVGGNVPPPPPVETYYRIAANGLGGGATTQLGTTVASASAGRAAGEAGRGGEVQDVAVGLPFSGPGPDSDRKVVALGDVPTNGRLFDRAAPSSAAGVRSRRAEAPLDSARFAYTASDGLASASPAKPANAPQGVPVAGAALALSSGKPPMPAAPGSRALEESKKEASPTLAFRKLIEEANAPVRETRAARGTLAGVDKAGGGMGGGGAAVPKAPETRLELAREKLERSGQPGAAGAKEDVTLGFDAEPSAVRLMTVADAVAAAPESETRLGRSLWTESVVPERDAGKALKDLSQNQGEPLPALVLAAQSPLEPAPEALPEKVTRDDAYSTFSLNVSDVSFKVAGAALAAGQVPEPTSIRSEEFLNALDYRDPAPPAGAPLGFVWERARHPFAQQRDVLRLSVRTAAQGREPGRPMNVVLVLDASGSMERPDRVATVRAALAALGGLLGAGDRISVVAFARTARLWVDGLSGELAGELPARVGNLVAEGGTNLEEAMRVGYETARRHFAPGGANHVVLLTDGAANLGEAQPEVLRTMVEENRRRGIALDCFGVGWDGLNDDLLEKLARNGDGRHGFLNSPEAAANDFAAQLAGSLQVAASDVKVQVEFNPRRVTVWRQVGYARHQLTKEQFRDNTVDAAELAASESGNAMYVIEPQPRGDGPIAVVRARFRVPSTGRYEEHAWVIPYLGGAPDLVQAPPTLRLAVATTVFAEVLARSPHAAGVRVGQILGWMTGVPDAFAPDPRPARLEGMLREAAALGL